MEPAGRHERGGEFASAVASDEDDNIYVVGETSGALAGPFKGGALDAWVIKFSSNGHRLWSRQPGTSANDSASGVATDKDGNVYVVGYASGALGGTYKGALDAWVIKFSSDGHRLWSRQPGTSANDSASGVATDKDGNVYVVGSTGPEMSYNADPFVIKFSRGGDVLWRWQPRTSGANSAKSVSTDTDGNVYVVGSTDGALGGPNKGFFDAWVIKFDGDGHVLWRRQPGTSGGDRANGVATDTDGNVIVMGETEGALGNKGMDAWVIKFSEDGNVLWRRQPGTSGGDRANGVSTDTDGNVYVVGSTDGALGGPNKGFEDAWVIKFDADGDMLWKRQPGTSMNDLAFGVATDRDGNAFVVGYSEGTLGGPNKGAFDAWVIKYAK